MPVFRTQPSGNLTGAIRRLLASGSSSLNPLQEMQADAMAAGTAHKMGLVEQMRTKLESDRAAEARRNDPTARTEYAGHAAGIDMPDATRLYKAISGARERPSQSGGVDMDDEGNRMPDVTFAKPENLQPGQDRLFRAALASLQGMGLATKATNAEELAKATGHTQEQGLIERVQDFIERGDLQRASAMSQGAKPGTAIKLHQNLGDTGATFAPATGAVQAEPANPLLAGTLTERASKAEQQRAAAVASRAAAGASTAHADLFRAQADKTRKEKPEGELGKPPTGYRWGPPDENGAPTLVPVAGGPAEKLGETQVKQIVGVKNTRDAITEYREALKKWGGADIMNPASRARMGTVYNNMLLQAKEAYNLGVLNGPDYMILQEVITSPSTLKGGITSKEALDDQAAKLDEVMGRIGLQVDASSKQRGGNAGPSASPRPETTKVLNGTTYVKVGGKWYQQ